MHIRLFLQEFSVQSCFADQSHAGGDGSASSVVGTSPEGLPEEIPYVFRVHSSGHICVGNRPANHVELSMLDRDDLSIVYGHQDCSFRTGLLYVATLQVAWINDVRAVTHDFMSMDMSKRPVIVAVIR